MNLEDFEKALVGKDVTGEDLVVAVALLAMAAVAYVVVGRILRRVLHLPGQPAWRCRKFICPVIPRVSCLPRDRYRHLLVPLVALLARLVLARPMR